MKKIKIICYTFLLLITQNSLSIAQCAMCRAAVGSNLSEGRGVIGTGINDGIIYLLVVTYLSVPTLIYIWFREAKKEQRKKQILDKFSLN
jgi:hypothetical protein